jgi:hypothetical protein
MKNNCSGALHKMSYADAHFRVQQSWKQSHILKDSRLSGILWSDVSSGRLFRRKTIANILPAQRHLASRSWRWRRWRSYKIHNSFRLGTLEDFCLLRLKVCWLIGGCSNWLENSGSAQPLATLITRNSPCHSIQEPSDMLSKKIRWCDTAAGRTGATRTLSPVFMLVH